MRRIHPIPLALTAVLTMAGCAGMDLGPASDLFGGSDEDVRVEETVSDEEVTESAPPTGMVDVPEAIDATLGSGGLFLGTTVASLGNPRDAGLWVRTPLVSEPTSGYVHYSSSNRSLRVELIPSGGAAGSGSRISLKAMQLLDAPLGELLELAVYQG